jgi:glycosyltransferase involved in cell wall biosynthesis
VKVLACAYACNPLHGSEDGVGWGWINAIARNHEVWVLTDGVYRSDIEAVTGRSSDRYGNLHFVYVPRRRWLTLEKLWPPAYLATYRIWQRDAYRVARELHEKVRFDLVHVVTFVGFRIPGPFFRLDVPFVWGPIGGLENTRWRFLPWLGPYGALYYACRNIVNTLHKRFLPLPKQAFRAARGGIIAATSAIQREIRRWYGEDSVVICEVGIPPEVAREHSRRNPDEPLRLCWSGLHLPGKALPLLLEALARVSPRVKWRLDILGAGPCMEKWRRRARRLRIDGNCHWHGQVPRAQALEIVGDSHVFVTTSVKDLTSTVVVEALAQGVPVVCPDHCGFSDAVDESCGLKLPVDAPRKFIAALSLAIERLYGDEALRSRLAAGAISRVHMFSWEEKASRLNAIYERKAGRVAADSHVCDVGLASREAGYGEL